MVLLQRTDTEQRAVPLRKPFGCGQSGVNGRYTGDAMQACCFADVRTVSAANPASRRVDHETDLTGSNQIDSGDACPLGVPTVATIPKPRARIR